MTRSKPRASSRRAAATLVGMTDAQIVHSGLASIAEAYTYLRCSRTTLYRYFTEGLPYCQEGSKRCVPWAGLYAFAAACLVRRDRAVVS